MNVGENAKKVKALRERVNNPDLFSEALFQEYTEARKELALAIMETSRDGKHVTVDRGTLSLCHKNDFPKGTVIDVGPYVIWVNRLKTCAARRESIFTNLVESQMPGYLHEFVF